MVTIRSSFACASLALAILVAPRAVPAQEPYGKYMVPPPPVTGEPPWKYKADPRVDAAKVRAAKLYVRAVEAVERVRADLDAPGTDRQLALARESLRRATELDATCVDCWSMLGYARCRTGDRAGARQAFARSLAIDPEHFATREYQAEADLADGRIENARAELEWLRTKGNMTTLETRNLTAAIERWTRENPNSEKPAGDAGRSISK